MEIRRIWFDKRYLYGEDAEGRVYRQSLLWYPALASASPEQKLAYKTGFEGFHWPDLGVDVSFESFVYEDAVPTPLQAFFLALLVLVTFPLRRYSGVIREEVKLLSLVLRLWYAFLADDVVGGDCYPPYQ